jgi:hypothetical protein
MTGAPKMR